MSSLHNPHDILAKRFLSHLAVAKDFLKAHLPQHIKDRCDFSMIKLEPTSYVEEDMRSHVTDLMYSLKIDKKIGFIYVLLEAQTKPLKFMPLRYLRYQTSAWKQYAENNPGKRLPVIIPILLYTGKESPYPYSLEFINCFEDSILAKEVLFKPIHLIDVSVIPDSEIKTHGHAALLEIVQKHIHDRDIFNLAYDIGSLLEAHKITRDLFINMLQYIIDQGESSRFDEFFKIISEQSKKYGDETMTIAQQLQQRGKMEATLEIAKAMLAQGFDLETVKNITKLPELELKKIAQLN